MPGKQKTVVPLPRGKIVAVSDSLTNDQPDNWLALLGAKCPGCAMISNSYGGWTTKSFFKEKFRDIAFANIPPDAAVFILLLGSNNLFEAQGGSDAAVQEATEGVDRLAAHLLTMSPGAEILLAAPPGVVVSRERLTEPKPERRIDAYTPGFLAKLSDSYRHLAARRGWRFVDLLPLLAENDFADAAHPNKEGNRKMAEAFWRVLSIEPRPKARQP